MYIIYMDSGTSTTRAFLLKGVDIVDNVSVKVGTKDSAINGSNEVLLSAMRDCYKTLLSQNSLQDTDIGDIWMSGMVTNNFGVVEVAHASTPVDAKKLAGTAHVHREDRFFHRDLHLIRGAKTVQPGQVVDISNIAGMNTVRGEEIEAIGLAASGMIPPGSDCVMISPGSHTHMLRIKNSAIVDISSNFTGELSHAIRTQTILGGELSPESVEMQEQYVLHGLSNLREYGIARSLCIIHASRVLNILSDEIRSQIFEGIISGSVVELLAKKMQGEWAGVQNVLILGGKPHIKAYEILCRHLLPPGTGVTLLDSQSTNSYALRGFLEILKVKAEG